MWGYYFLRSVDILCVLCLWVAGLSNVCTITCVTFKLVYATGVGIIGFVTELLVYCVCGPKSYLKLVLLNRLVTLCIEGLSCVKVTHFLLYFCSICVCVVPSFLAISCLFILCIRCAGKPLFRAMTTIIPFLFYSLFRDGHSGHSVNVVTEDCQCVSVRVVG